MSPGLTFCVLGLVAKYGEMKPRSNLGRGRGRGRVRGRVSGRVMVGVSGRVMVRVRVRAREGGAHFMPSTTSSSFSSVCPSCTVITPSLPTW